MPFLAAAVPVVMGALGSGSAAGSALTAASTLMGTAGQIAGGVGGMMSSQYAAKVASNNAVMDELNAQAARNKGQFDAESSLMKTGALIGQQKAAQGANGVDVNFGSSLGVRNSTALLGKIDANTIQYNAAREAWGYEVQKAQDRAQVHLDHMSATGSLIGGAFGAAKSFLGGAASLTEMAGKGGAAGLGTSASSPIPGFGTGAPFPGVGYNASGDLLST